MTTHLQVMRRMIRGVRLKQLAKRDIKTIQKVINKTRKTKVSSKQKQDTAGSNNRDKHLLEKSASQSCKEAEAESTAVEKTRSKRLSKTKAMSKITGHFEDVEITPPRDGSALVKAERKIWEDIAGMQKNECGLAERKRGSRRTVGKCRGGCDDQCGRMFIPFPSTHK